MLSETIKKKLRTKLELYEGSIAHMYLDSKGYVTVGIGHLLATLADAQKIPFTNAKKTKASADEIKTDYEKVKKQTKNRIASYYKKYTKLTLSAVEIDKLTNKHIDSFHTELKKIYSGFDDFPENVKLALFDMIFNLGMTNLKNKWPSFNKAIADKDWAEAAKQSNRKSPISAARNSYVKELLETAAADAKKAAK